MKRLCICCAVLVNTVNAEDSPIESKVYVDISKEAIDNAVKFDGARVLGGLYFAPTHVDTGSTSSKSYTNHKMNQYGVTLGFEYSKELKKHDLIAGIVGSIDITKKKTISGSWEEVNKEYYQATLASYPAGNKTASLSVESVIPIIALKGGYKLKKYQSVVFAKVGVSQIRTKYNYKLNDADIGNGSAQIFVPSLSVGAEKKINKKLGVSFEVNVGLKRKQTKQINGFNHSIKANRRYVQLIATYGVSK